MAEPAEAMNCVILQPSYIPWRGFFHQIQRADIFIFYDDAQYDKHGWRNRNQIKTAQSKQWLTIPAHTTGATQGLLIKDVRIDTTKPWAKNHLKALTFAYAKAPFFRHLLSFLEPFYRQNHVLLADFTIDLTIALTRELGIHHTRFMRSSELNASGEKTDRLINLLQKVDATHYISGPSAREYIEPEKFTQAGISLEYMEYNYPEYPQLYPPFDPLVSILDLLFMTGPDALSYIVGNSHETARD